MTHDDPDHAPGHDEVRRLLADARHNEPMPDAVAARLDRVLADLAGEPAAQAPNTQTPTAGPMNEPVAGPAGAPVVGLATRRRRVAQLLVAAAAVIVVGIGVGEVLDGSGSESDSSVAFDARDDAGAGQTQADSPEEAAPPASKPEPQDAESEGDGTHRDQLSREVSLRSSDFAADAREVAAYVTSGSLSGSFSDGLDRADALVDSCRAREWGAGSFVPVTYDGAPAVLVFRRARGDTQVADLFLCGSTEPLRSVTLPAP